MLRKIKNCAKKKQRYLHINIEYLLHAYSLDITSLSIETGVPIATIFRMKKEENNPTISSIEPIADFFKVELNDLLYEDISSDDYQNKKMIGDVQYIPIIKLQDINSWPIKFNAKLFIGTIGNLNTDSFGIAIDSNSMSPIFYNNSIILVDPAVQPKDSDYIFCILGDDKVPVLRQLFIDGNNYFFKPINPNYGEMILIKAFKIIGVIVKSIENYR